MKSANKQAWSQTKFSIWISLMGKEMQSSNSPGLNDTACVLVWNTEDKQNLFTKTLQYTYWITFEKCYNSDQPYRLFSLKVSMSRNP